MEFTQNIGLLSLSNNEQKMVENLLRLPFTYSEKKEVLKYIEEICLRDEISLKKLFAIVKLEDLYNNREKGVAKEIVQKVRGVLHKSRFPHLAKRESEFAEWKRQVKLPPEIHLTHSPNFEQDWLEVRFRFKNNDELVERINNLNRIYH